MTTFDGSVLAASVRLPRPRTSPAAADVALQDLTRDPPRALPGHGDGGRDWRPPTCPRTRTVSDPS